MSWFYVHDGLHASPKLAALPPKTLMACMGLWVLAGSWSRSSLTGGKIPSGQVSRLGGTRSQAEALVAAGLWDRAEGGYQFHDWHDWQFGDDADELAAKKREQTRLRVRAHRLREAAKRNALPALPRNADSVTDALHMGRGEGDVVGVTSSSTERDSGDGSPDALEALAVQAEGCGHWGRE